MLNHLGIEAFVGGNLGNPLSDASFDFLMLPSSKSKFQVTPIVKLNLLPFSFLLPFFSTGTITELENA